jgi:hypothetical protein
MLARNSQGGQMDFSNRSVTFLHSAREWTLKREKIMEQYEMHRPSIQSLAQTLQLNMNTS